MKEKPINIIFSILVSIILTACSHDNSILKNLEETQKPLEKPHSITIPSGNSIGVTLYKPEVYDGFTLFTIFKNTYLINNCGQVINHWKSDYVSGNAVYLLSDGSILRAGKIDNPNMPLGGLGGIVERIGWNGQVLWSYTYSGENFTQHHDIFPMANGNVIVLAATKKTKDQVIQAGRDSLLIEDSTLYNEQLLELKPTGTRGALIVWEWNIWDHLIQQFDSTKDNFGSVAENPQLLDINYLGEGENNSDADWLHINGIDYNSALDQLLLSIHGLDELVIIDHSTTIAQAASHEGGRSQKGGDLLYRWGNPQAYKRGTADDRKLFKQHHPNWIPSGYTDGGKIIVYNNGNGRPENFSSVDIINPITQSAGNYPLSQGNSYGPQEPDWTYYDPVVPTNFYSKLLSGAQRLPNGNTLICEGINGRVFEIDTESNKVWEYINPQTTTGTVLNQGNKPESNRLFRATKYPKDYPAFKGKNINPKNPIELDFNIGLCE